MRGIMLKAVQIATTGAGQGEGALEGVHSDLISELPNVIHIWEGLRATCRLRLGAAVLLCCLCIL